MIAAHLKSLVTSPFARAVAMLSSGQFVTALLPMLAAPVLGRLYTPSDYGPLGLYMSIAAVASPLSTLQLHLGILAETEEASADELVITCIAVAAGIALAASIPVAVLYAYLAANDMFTGARGWLLLLPLTIVSGGITASVAMLANRRKRYGFIARNQIVVTAATIAISIALGYVGWGTAGIFVAYFIGQAVAALAHVRLFSAMTKRFPSLTYARFKALVLAHKKYAIFTMPAELIGNFNQSIPVYALTMIGTAADIGGFSRARQLIAMPLTLVGSAIAQVFRQRAAEDYRTTGSCAAIYKKTFVALASIGAPAMLIVMAFAPDIFRIVLGPNWTEAGRFAQILSPMLLLRLICSPLSTVFYFTGSQRLDFALALVCGAGLALAMLVAVLLRLPATTIAVVYSAAFTLIYLIFIIVGWRLTGRTQ